MITGIGTDIVEVERIARLWRDKAEAFAARVFTDAELAYCLARPHSEQHLAARFAAKEAALKALGTGWAKGLGFDEIEVVRDETSGAPILRFHGKALEAIRACGVQHSHVSLSHTAKLATATVILEA